MDGKPANIEASASSVHNTAPTMASVALDTAPPPRASESRWWARFPQAPDGGLVGRDCAERRAARGPRYRRVVDAGAAERQRIQRYAAAGFTSAARRSIARTIAGTPARGRSNVTPLGAERPRPAHVDATSATEP